MMLPLVRHWRAPVLVALLLLLLGPLVSILVSASLRDYLYREISYELIARRVIGTETDPERIALRLNEFVAENVYPGGGPVLDANAWNDLVRGIGWCDQDSWLLGTLLASRGMPGRIVYLNGDGGSPAHTMAEVQLQGDWRLFDPLYGLVFRKPGDGSLATLSDMTRNVALVGDHPDITVLPPSTRRQVEEFFTSLFVSSSARNPNRWAPLIDIKRSSAPRALMHRAIQGFVDLFGTWGAYSFQDLYLALLPDELPAVDAAIKDGNRPVLRSRAQDPALFVYYRARNYHLYNRFEKARRAYDEVLRAYSRSPYSEKSLYFLAIADLNAPGQESAAIGRLTSFLELYPDSAWKAPAHYWLGRAHERLERIDAAREHYRRASEDPYVPAAVRLHRLDTSSTGSRGGAF